MAQVPYSPVPDVVPSYAPTSEQHVATPGAAFGESQGQALSTLGSVTDKAGVELATRALAMQQLKNESDSRATVVDAAAKGQQLYQDFASKSGANASPQALTEFQTNLDKIRQDARAGLNNPMAQKLFDDQYTSEQIRLGNLAAGHAARELKSYNELTHKSLAEQALNTATLTPLDPAARQKAFATSDADVETRFAGQSKEVIDNEKAKAHSVVAFGQITSLAQTNPTAALAMLNEDVKNNVLRGEVIGKAKEFVDREMNRHQSREISHGLADGSSIALGDTDVGLPKTAAGVRQVESGNNYSLLTGPVGYRKIGAYSILETAAGGAVGENFKFYLKKAGLPLTTTVEQFVADKDMQDKAFAAVYNEGIAKGHTSNDIAGRWQQGHYVGEGQDVVDGNNVSRADYLRRFNEALYKGSDPATVAKAARTLARKADPTNPDLEDYSANHAVTEFNQQKSIEEGTKINNKLTIDAEIEKQINSGSAVTLDSLKGSSPEVAKALEASDPLDVQGRIIRAKARDNNWTQQRDDTFNTLVGQAHIAPTDFKKVDLSKENLTAEQYSTLHKLQLDVNAKGSVDDPVVKKAIRDPDVIALAHSLGIGPHDKNPDEWNKFTGALAEEVTFLRAQGKDVSSNDVQDIANKLVQDRAGSGLFGMFSSKEYQIPLHAIPPERVKEERDFLRGKLKSSGTDREPTDQEIEQLHALRIYKATQGAKANGR